MNTHLTDICMDNKSRVYIFVSRFTSRSASNRFGDALPTKCPDPDPDELRDCRFINHTDCCHFRCKCSLIALLLYRMFKTMISTNTSE